MELADSITLDPHKWFYQPVEMGALLVRDGSRLRRAFEVSHDYLKDIQTTAQEVNFSDLGLQLTRTCRALKLWMSVRYFGLAAFRRRSTAASIWPSMPSGGSRHRHSSSWSRRHRWESSPSAAIRWASTTSRRSTVSTPTWCRG